MRGDFLSSFLNLTVGPFWQLYSARLDLFITFEAMLQAAEAMKHLRRHPWAKPPRKKSSRPAIWSEPSSNGKFHMGCEKPGVME